MSAAPEKPVVWLEGEVKTPPFTAEGRREAGALLGRLQAGELIGMPLSRPMPSVGPGVHELRVRDAGHNWRIVYHVDAVAVAVLDVFPKTTAKTPRPIIAACRRRLVAYLKARDGE